MAKPIPTQSGDVLIVRTTQSYTIHAVGRISKDGQQDLCDAANVTHETDYSDAVALAKALVSPGRRIFVRNLDTGDWSEISV